MYQNAKGLVVSIDSGGNELRDLHKKLCRDCKKYETLEVQSNDLEELRIEVISAYKFAIDVLEEYTGAAYSFQNVDLDIHVSSTKRFDQISDLEMLCADCNDFILKAETKAALFDQKKQLTNFFCYLTKKNKNIFLSLRL